MLDVQDVNSSALTARPSAGRKRLRGRKSIDGAGLPDLSIFSLILGTAPSTREKLYID
ncbi:protein of unknown function [Methanoculleus bourgensis]|uniref:Uncharacterized protein n=1 Tax=Methanoculleus bourgensis TaxID=83986 RepID=A0A0X3BPX6_9EURY|nr:protein of unknown function [Methanoculleus bourgensis]